MFVPIVRRAGSVAVGEESLKPEEVDLVGVIAMWPSSSITRLGREGVSARRKSGAIGVSRVEMWEIEKTKPEIPFDRLRSICV